MKMIVSLVFCSPPQLSRLEGDTYIVARFDTCVTGNMLPQTFVPGFHSESDVRKMMYKSLGNTGMFVSYLSLGSSQLGYLYQTSREEDGINMVREAIRKGINYIDTSPWYGFGTADIVLGKALKGIPRQAYYLGTKVGRYNPEYPRMFDFSAAKTIQSVEESLQKLGVDYVDVIQVHDLEFASSLDIILHETLPALQKIKESGKARFIGITGYPLGVLREVVERSTVKLDSVLSYCRCTLFDQSLLEHIPFFQKHGLGIINAANLGMSLLTEHEIPKWHPVLPEIRAACTEAVRYCKDQGVDISKLAICFSLNHLGIDTHLTGMAEPAHLEKNLKTLFDGLDAKEETVLEEIQKRFFRPLVVRHWEEVGVKKYWQKLAVKK